MSMSSGSRDYGRFDELAEEFAGRFRRGERPSLRSTSIASRSWPTRSATCSRPWSRSSRPRSDARAGTARRRWAPRG